MKARPSADELVAGVRGGDRGWLARAITLVESRRDDDRRLARLVVAELLPRSGTAYRIGLTGVPGVGKSTLIEKLGLDLCAQGHRVAVLAIDPSSQRSGGSILGDKSRMQRLANHPMAYVRPSPSAGIWGGVARATRTAMLLCEAAGFDVVLVETVGVGQSETLVAQMVDCFILLLLANAGDELQGIKRGIVELADILAINKADGDNQAAAQAAALEFRRALSLMQRPHPQWEVPVLQCSGLTGAGVDEVWQKAMQYRELRQRDGSLRARREEQNVDWIWHAVREEMITRLQCDADLRSMVEHFETMVRAGQVSADAAAIEIVDAYEATRARGTTDGYESSTSP
jgi:LAO/AO transport system kinase